MAKVICVANQKGGVGKTALSSNLAASLALEGKQVLMVDLDALCSLTKAYGYDPQNFEVSLSDALQSDKMVVQAIYETDIEGLSLLPSSAMLDVVDVSLYKKKDSYGRLKALLGKVSPAFDYIVLDCSPSLNAVTINALVASDYILIPAETKFQSDFSLEVFISTIETLKATQNPSLQVLGVVATMFNCQANEDKEVLEKLKESNKVLGVVKRTTAVSSSVKVGKPCVVASKRSVAAQEYRSITKKILKEMEGHNNA